MLRSSFVFAVSALLVAAAASSAPTTHYRSIGNAANYTTGTVTAVNGETYVIGSIDVQWKMGNRGRGDRISIAGTPYTILSVDAENELTLTAPYAGATTFGAAYTISRKFQRLRDWEDCLEATVPCPDVITANLVTEDRIEFGVVYKDSKYFTNTGGEQLRLDDPLLITDVNHTITLTTTKPNRHHGVQDTGVILDNGSEASAAIEIRTSFVLIEWIELHNGDADGQIRVMAVGDQSQIVVRNVLFRDNNNIGHGIHINADDAKVRFYNNILYGLEHGVNVRGLTSGSLGLFEFYHNTFSQNLIGLHSEMTPDKNDVIVMNGNLAHANLSADFDALATVPDPMSGKNWSTDNTGPNPGHGPGGVQIFDPATIMFVSTASPVDLHIKRGSIVEDAGAAIAEVVEDIDGRNRGTPDIGADEADSSSANPVKILTAKSAFELVQLEWQHPDFGPQAFVEVHRSTTAFPTQPSVPTLACGYPAPAPGTKGQCTDTLLPRVNGTPYYYSAFLYDVGGNYSKEASVIGMPFDNGAVAPEWTYGTKAATLEPAGVRGPNAFVVSNDNFYHAMQGGAGPGAGEWPGAGWAPYKLPDAVQHRPVIVNINGNTTALLGAQDGRVYAVDIATGRLVWKSPMLGGSIDAAPAALVAAYSATGGGADHVFVGTSDASSNALFILDLMTGAIVERFDDFAQPTNIGPITGVAVKYPSGPVFFTSDDGSGGSNRNVWSIDVSVLPLPPGLNWSDNPGPIDAGPTLYQSMLFVGSRAGDLIGYNDVGTLPLFTHPLGNGALKAPIFPVFWNDTLLVSTDDKVSSVQFTATGGCSTPPCTNWTQSLGAAASPVLFIPGTTQVYVGAGSGSLWELSINLPSPSVPPAVRTWSISPSGLGGPTFSIPQLTLYVSDTSGKVHGIPWPIP